MIRPFLYISVLVLTFIACRPESGKPPDIRVGCIAGPEAELLEYAKQLSQQRKQLSLRIMAFSDYVMPNRALDEGSIDVNIFQHQAYLENAVKRHGYAFVSIGKTFVFPMAIYSQRYRNLKALPRNGTIAIPNDPSNSARALRLLAKAGLITLQSTKHQRPSVQDILSNPKNFVIRELDAAQLPRVLPDVAAAVINSNYAMQAHLQPKRDGLLAESANSPYANLIVVRKKDRQNPKFAQLVALLNSAEVRDYAKKLFFGQAIPAWTAAVDPEPLPGQNRQLRT